MTPNFTKQPGQPLFPQILWSRPTMKSRAGRLLIVGGQKHEFSQVQAIYQLADAAGIGECKAALPDTLRRTIGESEFGWFLPAAQSGSLGKAALSELLHLAADFDCLVLGVNLTTNAETGIMIERLIREYEGRVVITEETIRILKFNPDLITGNPKALVVTTMAGLFELANHHHLPLAIKPNSGVVGKIEIVRQLADISRCAYFVFDQEIIVTVGEQTSLTSLARSLSRFPGVAIGVGGTFWLQHPGQSYEALTTAAYVIRETIEEAGSSYAAMAAGVQKVLSKLDDH